MSSRPAPLTSKMATTQSADTMGSWFSELDDVPTSSGTTPQPAARWWKGSGDGASEPGAAQRAEGSPYARMYRAFLAARAGLGVMLIIGVVTSALLNRSIDPEILAVAIGYAVLSVLWWWWPSQRVHRIDPDLHMSTRQALATVGVDLGSFAVLSFLDRGFNINTAALMALPVLMTGVFMPRFMALAAAAAATLILLTGAVLEGVLRDNLTTSLTPAGLTGFGLFAVALLVSELSSRLAREQRSARGSMELARQQAQLNRLVIEEMPEGVLAVDRQGRVRTANPSARKLLSAHGLTPAAPFQLRGVPAWEPLVKSIEQAFTQPRRVDDSRELQITFDDHTRRALRMRLKFTRGRDTQNQDDVCVVFLEDVRTVQARVRQDKLAAMGRMSAGIAHEIRNPLAAISQANALLAEDAISAPQQRLTSMVADNVERLKRIVDDILAVAPGARAPAPAIDLERLVRAVVDEWLKLHPVAANASQLKLDTSGLPPRDVGTPARVIFEPEHFRRVLVNLLDNALRHGSSQPGSIRVEAQLLMLQDQSPQALVSVFSDGLVIEGQIERSLFEPFFSTRSRGTGLGLYICRELCERHGASIDFRAHPPTQRHRNEFYILMPLAEFASPAP
ncbi:histidine kinase [Aquabacterium soli]|uniref:histidine kinase n=1 Tax=Aquabacterium soli TaxID=2493092 RepID=A0A3R8RZP1_9BURK|nr:ATP-binding protein [Aquabacterium soli]RRS00979.1 histidine kinase [Aquabacterium soli]